MLSGHAALGLYGVRAAKIAEPIHVLIPHRRRRRSVDGLVTERTTRLPDHRSRDGLPCAPVERALIDAARMMTDFNETRALVSKVVQRGLVTVAQLAEELRACQKGGTALVKAVLGEVTGCSVGGRSTGTRTHQGGKPAATTVELRRLRRGRAVAWSTRRALAGARSSRRDRLAGVAPLTGALPAHPSTAAPASPGRARRTASDPGCGTRSAAGLHRGGEDRVGAGTTSPTAGNHCPQSGDYGHRRRRWLKTLAGLLVESALGAGPWRACWL
jgi:hypothetical protein